MLLGANASTGTVHMDGWLAFKLWSKQAGATDNSQCGSVMMVLKDLKVFSPPDFLKYGVKTVKCEVYFE